MRAKRDWEQLRSPHARFLEGLEAAVAAHPSAGSRGGANAGERRRSAKPLLTVVGSEHDNVIPLPTRRAKRSGSGPRRGGPSAA